MNQLLKIALRAASEAGDLICRDFRHLAASDIQAKSKNDFVTRVDREAEVIIKDAINQNFPDHRILAEESGYSAKAGEYLWVIDPLDGTANFIHGIGHFAVSLALLENNIVIFGLIYDPLSKDCFHGFINRGAFLNGRPIAVSRTTTLAAALGATGFPFKAPEQAAAYAEAFKSLLSRCEDMRRCGSAALDMAYMACGRYDFFWEAHLMPWDFMAGKLIVEEAGGLVSDFSGRGLSVRTSSVLAANGMLHLLLHDLIGKFFK